MRSSPLELMGSGFGSASLEQILLSVSEFFQEAAKKPFQINIETAPLRDVEILWERPERGARMVFRP